MAELIPEAVRKQKEKAEATQKKLADAKSSSEKKEKDKKPETMSETKTPSPEEESSAPKPNDDWEHRYKVLKGKYDAEVAADVPQLQETIESLRQANTQLQNQLVTSNAMIQNLNEIIRGLKGADIETDDQDVDEIADDGTTGPVDLEEFAGWGDEVVKLAKEVNRLNSIIERQEKVIRELIQSQQAAQETQQNTAEDQFWSDLRKQVSDCDAINVEPAFLEWLNGFDEHSGLRLNDLLQYHYGAWDVERVAKIFNAYKEATGRLKPQKTSKSTGPTIEDQVMPDSGGTATTVVGEENAPTAKDVEEAAQKFTKGKITQDEYTEISRAWQRANAKRARQAA